MGEKSVEGQRNPCGPCSVRCKRLNRPPSKFLSFISVRLTGDRLLTMLLNFHIWCIVHDGILSVCDTSCTRGMQGVEWLSQWLRLTLSSHPAAATQYMQGPCNFNQAFQPLPYLVISRRDVSHYMPLYINCNHFLLKAVTNFLVHLLYCQLFFELFHTCFLSLQYLYTHL